MKTEGICNMNLKYLKELYIDCGFYGGDFDGGERCHTEKLVKCRNVHTCSYCKDEINPGQYALRENAIIDDLGWCSCYTCTKCIEDWLEETGQAGGDE